MDGLGEDSLVPGLNMYYKPLNRICIWIKACHKLTGGLPLITSTNTGLELTPSPYQAGDREDHWQVSTLERSFVELPSLGTSPDLLPISKGEPFWLPYSVCLWDASLGYCCFIGELISLYSSRFVFSKILLSSWSSSRFYRVHGHHLDRDCNAIGCGSKPRACK